ncbi:DNA polymerase III subunit delta [Hominifimenecus sp. rT4P-3]|uniref:DNA polymerase III subunit delta n=1 Tax=Hominifimenecus sp. rT4P-3 TaxID=3242979 RepID=UPI003DA48F48
MQKINSDIKSGSFAPAYLLYGEEAFLRRSYKNRLRQAMVGDDTMNFTYYEGKDFSVTELMDIAETLPFFAERRLIIVENSGFFKKESGELADYLDRMPDTTHLLFVEEEVDKRNKLYKRVTKLGYAAECKRQTAGELKKWAARGLAQSGKKITESTLELFLTKTGDDMENIHRELEKLIGYIGEREVVEAGDVEAITTTQLSNRIFDMIHAIAAGERRKALALYGDLLALKEPPMRILFLIARQFHGLLQVKELREQGVGKDEIASKCRLQPFLVGRYMSQASRFTKEQLEDYVRLAVETEDAVKKGNLKDNLAVELLLVQFSER